MPSYIRARSEFTVNSFTAESQTAPSVSTFADGGFIVTWVTTDPTQDGEEGAIKAQLFDSTGSKVGSEFLVNLNGSGHQFSPAVETFANGNFVVSWVSYYGATGTYEIKAQMFGRNGNPIGAEFQADEVGDMRGVFEPKVTSLADGRFIISWDDLGDVKAQMFDSSGARIGGIFKFNTTWAEGFGDVVALANGGFVATWRTTGNGWDVKAQVFNAAGGKVGGEFLVNTVVAGSQNAPAATALADGGFVITWTDIDGSNDERVKAQMYTATGQKVGGEILVSTQIPDFMGSTVVTALPDGGFIVAWSNGRLIPGGGSDSEVIAQRFSAAGVKVDGEFQINTLTTGSQSLADLDTLADGRVIAVWASGSGDGSGQSVRAQILGTEVQAPQPNARPIIISNGGGTSASVTQDEGVTAVTTVVAADDGEPTALRYSITGGLNANLFTINALTGALSFKTPPDHVDGAANFYTVTVSASDGELSGFQTIQISVIHVNHITIVSDGGYDYAYLSIDENQTGVTTVSAVDDDGAPLTYTITGGQDAAFFTIDAQTGELRFTAAPDYEAPANMYGDNVYLVQVTVTDGTRSDTQDLYVQVNDVDDGGFSIISNGGGEQGDVGVDENGTAVTVVAAQGAAGPVTYEIAGGYDASLFTIDPETGALSFVDAPDFEQVTQQYGYGSHYYYYGGFEVVVRASDGVSEDYQELRVVVQDVDEAPILYSYWGEPHVDLTIAENTQWVGYVAAEDPDFNSYTRYGIGGGADAALFSVDPYTGEISFRQAPNHEAPADSDRDNVYEVSVVAYSGMLSVVQTFSITVADEVEPVVISSDGGGDLAVVKVPENSKAVTVVSAGGSNVVYGIVGGADASYFTIDRVTGALSFITAPNYEGTPIGHSGDKPHGTVYDVIVRADDGMTFDEQRLSVRVQDVDEPVQVSSYGGAANVGVTIAENTLAAATVFARDPDRNSIVTFTLAGADSALFQVDSAGKLSFRQAPDFEAPGDSDRNNVYQVTVVATSGSSSASQAFSVTISDVNENVTITSNGGGDSAALAIAENGTAVTIVAASGPGSVTYSIVGGADAADFTINSATGALAFASAPNFEWTADFDHDNVFEVVVRAGNGSTSDDQSLSVSVTNVDEAPVFFDDEPGVIQLSTAENRAYIGILDAYDVDGGPAISYSVTGGADGALFTIDPVTGEFSFIGAGGPDFEAPADAGGDNRYDVEVTATAGTWSRARTFTVIVNDDDEPLVITSNGGGTSAAVSMDEGRTIVTTVVAHDPEGKAPVYSITGGPDAARFAIDSATGVLSFVAAPDYEAPADDAADNFYTVQVSASDGVHSVWQTVQILIGNVNEGLDVTSYGGADIVIRTIGENEQASVRMEAVDRDGDTLTYSITGGADAALFAIDAATGALSFRSLPDYEAPADEDGDNDYIVTVTVTDGQYSASQTFAFGIANANERAAIGSNGGGASASLSVSENGRAVTTVVATDPDGTAPVYAIVGGADASRFTIDAATGALQFVSAPDRESPADADGNNVYEVVVGASDGELGDTQALSVTVANVDEGVEIRSYGGDDTVFLSQPENGAAVGQIAAADLDGDAVTYAIVGGADAALFAIDSATGVLRFIAAPNFEAPADANLDNVYKVEIAATSGAFSDRQAFAVTIVNANEGLAITSQGGADSAYLSIAENGRFVTVVAGTDQDGDAVTYSIAGGADAARFTINPQTGLLQFVAAPNYETPSDANGDNVYTVVVRASDGQFSDLQTLNVGVSNVRDGANVTGTTGNDAINGTAANPALRTTSVEDTVSGRDGHDTIDGLAGDDWLSGDAGNDTLIGGAGADRLTGGLGKDEFVYNSTADSTAASRDVITDFSRAQGDRINLSAIDANVNALNNQAFTFIGSAAFSHVAGQLRFEQAGGSTFVSGDVNGDGIADFQIELSGTITPVASDFVL